MLRHGALHQGYSLSQYGDIALEDTLYIICGRQSAARKPTLLQIRVHNGYGTDTFVDHQSSILFTILGMFHNAPPVIYYSPYGLFLMNYGCTDNRFQGCTLILITSLECLGSSVISSTRGRLLAFLRYRAITDTLSLVLLPGFSILFPRLTVTALLKT